MFELKFQFGDHMILSYDTKKHTFIEFFQDLFNTKELNKLGTDNVEFDSDNLSDVETTLHKLFYTTIKENDRFKRIYCTLIKDIYAHFFPNDRALIYQSFPSVRFQFKNNVAVPPHCDSDDIAKHPIGEKNFLLPITKMFGSNRLYIESQPEKKDFRGVDLDYGDLFYFNGNKCTHYNEKNIEDTIRISLDFRVMTVLDYIKYIESKNITTTNPRDSEKKRVPVKMTIGGYYQIVFRDEGLDDMMKWHFQKDLLLQSQPSFDINEANACFEYLRSGTNFITEFKKTEELEKKIQEFIGCKHAIMTTSGNMALILSIMAYDFNKGDEIIVPNYTMIASVNSIKILGLNPVLIDVDPETYTINLKDIKNALSSKTRAVLHVSLNNRSKDLKEIVDYCCKNSLVLIEDAAQSLGCRLNGKHYGTFGDIGCFSLSTPKIISTGQGGFITTNNDLIATKIKMIKNFGRKSGGVDIFEVFGINAKFTDIQAVIGLEQLTKLNNRISKYRDIFDSYYKMLNNLMIKPQSDEYIPWFIEIFVENRDLLISFLKEHNIQTRVTYPEINKTPMYNERSIEYPNTAYISNNGLFLPTHTNLDDSSIRYICKIILLFNNI
jgi:perosamine synthetase